jgi:hypothetical protein
LGTLHQLLCGKLHNLKVLGAWMFGSSYLQPLHFCVTAGVQACKIATITEKSCKNDQILLYWVLSTSCIAASCATSKRLVFGSKEGDYPVRN